MLSNVIKGKYERFKGFLKESWGHMTSNQDMVAEGRKLQYFGKSLEKHGLTKEEVKHRTAKFVEESKGAQDSTFKY